jgi:hypothetical protein
MESEPGLMITEERGMKNREPGTDSRLSTAVYLQ